MSKVSLDLSRVKFTPEELRECYTDKNMSQREISQLFHVDVRKVRIAMQRWDIPVKAKSEVSKINIEKRRQKNNGKIPPPRGPTRKCPPKEVLEGYRFEQGMSITQIAKMLELSRQTVRNTLKGYEPAARLHYALYDNNKWERGVLALYREYLRNAKLRKYSFELTVEQFYLLIKGNCYYCGKPPYKRGQHNLVSNGVDRIDSTQGYTVANTRSCCSACNRMKGSLSEQEFISWILEAADHLRSSSHIK